MDIKRRNSDLMECGVDEYAEQPETEEAPKKSKKKAEKEE